MDEAGGWGLLRFDPAAGTIDPAPNAKLFVLAQYSRHLRPGLTVLGTGDVDTVAAYDAVRRVLVLVTAVFKAPRGVTYDLGAFAAAVGPVTRWATSPAAGASDRYTRYDDAAVDQETGTLAFDFPADTIMTFEIENVDL